MLETAKCILSCCFRPPAGRSSVCINLPEKFFALTGSLICPKYRNKWIHQCVSNVLEIKTPCIEKWWLFKILSVEIRQRYPCLRCWNDVTKATGIIIWHQKKADVSGNSGSCIRFVEFYLNSFQEKWNLSETKTCRYGKSLWKFLVLNRRWWVIF